MTISSKFAVAITHFVRGAPRLTGFGKRDPAKPSASGRAPRTTSRLALIGQRSIRIVSLAAGLVFAASCGGSSDVAGADASASSGQPGSAPKPAAASSGPAQTSALSSDLISPAGWSLTIDPTGYTGRPTKPLAAGASGPSRQIYQTLLSGAHQEMLGVLPIFYSVLAGDEPNPEDPQDIWLWLAAAQSCTKGRELFSDLKAENGNRERGAQTLSAMYQDVKAQADANPTLDIYAVLTLQNVNASTSTARPGKTVAVSVIDPLAVRSDYRAQRELGQHFGVPTSNVMTAFGFGGAVFKQRCPSVGEAVSKDDFPDKRPWDRARTDDEFDELELYGWNFAFALPDKPEFLRVPMTADEFRDLPSSPVLGANEEVIYKFSLQLGEFTKSGNRQIDISRNAKLLSAEVRDWSGKVLASRTY